MLILNDSTFNQFEVAACFSNCPSWIFFGLDCSLLHPEVGPLRNIVYERGNFLLLLEACGGVESIRLFVFSRPCTIDDRSSQIGR